MSIGTDGSQGRDDNPKPERGIRLVKGCPCYKTFDDEKICVNADNVLTVDAIETDPAIFESLGSRERIDKLRAADSNMCYMVIYVNYPDNGVYCVSQGWRINIHGKDIPGHDLERGLNVLSTTELSVTTELCSKCIYNYLMAMSLTFADSSTRREKIEAKKRYVDEFALRIAIELSRTSGLSSADAGGNQIQQVEKQLAFLRRYLIELKKQQSYWSNLAKELQKEGAEAWTVGLIDMVELLVKLEFQFYSQTLHMRDIDDSHLLAKILSYVLRTSDEILVLNQEIHREIRSQRFRGLADKDQRFAPLRAYGEKSRVIEHIFGNIRDIIGEM